MLEFEKFLKLMAMHNSHKFIKILIELKEMLKPNRINSLKTNFPIDVRFQEGNNSIPDNKIFLQILIIFPYNHTIPNHFFM